MARTSTLQFEKAPRQNLSVRVPSDITEKDFGRLGKSIVEIIKNHTGCNCLSGVIRVVLEDDMKDAIRVELG